jgi:hypothetical protein
MKDHNGLEIGFFPMYSIVNQKRIWGGMVKIPLILGDSLLAVTGSELGSILPEEDLHGSND